VVAVSLREGSAPDVVVDAEGHLHAAYLSGDNVVYGQLRKDGEPATDAVRVNDVFGTASGGAYRGPDLDLAPDGRVHVAFYGNEQAPDVVVEPGLHYAYRAPGSTFTAARSLNRRPSDNFALAVDGDRYVEVLWTTDALYVQRSEDGGDTWSEPERVHADALPCECCATRLLFTPDHARFVLYRDRKDDIRDVHVIVDGPAGPARHRLATEPWKITGCPMSGMALTPGPGGHPFAAWQTLDAIELSPVDAQGRAQAGPFRVPGGPGKRYPAIAVAADGTILVAYKIATTLHWQLFSAAGIPEGETGSQATETPDRPAAAALPDGTFVVLG
jgi:hypothetical protein